MSQLNMVYAVSRNNVIGRDGELPWHLKGDLRRFKELTLGGVVIMGRKTHESILARLGHPLPGRTSIVVSRQLAYSSEGCLAAASLDEALQRWTVDRQLQQQDAYIIGGASLITAGMDLAGRIYLTYVDAEVEGDVSVPPIDWHKWGVGAREHYEADSDNDYPYRFLRLERRPA